MRKLNLKKLKAVVQFDTPRKRFIGLEIVLAICFYIGYQFTNTVFLTDYVTVRHTLDPLVYGAYLICMLAICGILFAMVFLGGMYCQRWITDRAAKIIMQKMKDDPGSILDLLQNGDLNG